MAILELFFTLIDSRAHKIKESNYSELRDSEKIPGILSIQKLVFFFFLLLSSIQKYEFQVSVFRILFRRVNRLKMIHYCNKMKSIKIFRSHNYLFFSFA